MTSYLSQNAGKNAELYDRWWELHVRSLGRDEEHSTQVAALQRSAAEEGSDGWGGIGMDMDIGMAVSISTPWAGVGGGKLLQEAQGV